MVDEVEGDGWKAVRPDPADRATWETIDPLVPEADWFWISLQRECVPECCGLAAYDFSADSVAWACGWGITPPATGDWRDDNLGSPQDLASELHTAAERIRRLDAKAVSGSLFNDILTPEAYALLFEDLADKAVPPS